MNTRYIIYFCTALLCLFLPIKAHSFSVPIRVEDTEGIERILQPVTVGVPVPRGKFFLDSKTSQPPFKVTKGKGGESVTAQFKVLSFYEDKSIRWVLVDFLASVGAKKKGDYWLSDGGKGNIEHGVLKVEDDDGDLSIDTGVIRLGIVSGGFNILDTLSVIDDKSGEETEFISSSDDAGIVLTGPSGKQFFSSFGETSEFRVEERGPVRVVVLVRGSLCSEDKEIFKEGNARYTCRITVYRMKPIVKLSVTLENLGKYGFRHEDSQSEAYTFKSLVLNIPLNFSASEKSVITEEYSGKFGDDKPFSLFQYHQLKDKHDELKNFFYSVSKGSEEEMKGFRDPGWVDVGGNQFGVTAYVKNYWQNFPKETAFSGNTLSLGLWPWGCRWPPTLADELRESTRKTRTKAGEVKLEADEAISQDEEDQAEAEENYDKKGDKLRGIRDRRSTYRFRGGLRKTYEVTLRFYKGEQDKNYAKDWAHARLKPLVARCDGEWYRRSGALGFFSEAGWKTDDVRLREIMKRYEKLQRCKVHLKDAESQRGGEVKPSTIYTEREQRGEGASWYGWMDFGDMAWGGNNWEGGYCSLHYDWTYGMLLQFLRSGDVAFFTLADEMARHRMDIDQYYSPSGSPWLSGFQWNEFGKHDRLDDDPWEPLPSHTWIQGMVLYHMITGNAQALETAKQAGAATKYYWTHTFDEKSEPGDEEVRIQGWSIENLLSLYDLTGKKEYLKLAHNIYKYRFRPFLKKGGYTGSPRYVNIYWLLLASEPLAKLYERIKDPDLLDDILKISNFLTFKAYHGGTFDKDNLYAQLYLPYHYNVKTNIPYDPYPPYNFLAANLIAYSYLKTGNPIFLGFSRRVFRDAVNYWQEGIEPNFPNKLSPLAYAAVHFPGSRTKVHGFISRYPLVYLYMEQHLKTDSVIPASVTDLELSSYSPGEVVLDWTSPQDNSIDDPVSGYDIRYARKPILTEFDWLSAKRVKEKKAPAKPGSVETLTVSGLTPGRSYYFAIKSMDDENNYSKISNIPFVVPSGFFYRYSKRDGAGGYIDTYNIYDGTAIIENGDAQIRTLGKVLGVGKDAKKERKALMYFQLDSKELGKIKRAAIKMYCRVRTLPPPEIVVREAPPDYFITEDRSENLEPVKNAVSHKVKKGSVKNLFRSIVSLSGLTKSFPKSLAAKNKNTAKNKFTHKKGRKLGKVLDSVTPWVRKRWYSWDVTDIVKAWAKDGKKRYFLFENASNEGQAAFVSSENTNTATRPVLEIVAGEK